MCRRGQRERFGDKTPLTRLLFGGGFKEDIDAIRDQLAALIRNNNAGYAQQDAQFTSIRNKILKLKDDYDCVEKPNRPSRQIAAPSQQQRAAPDGNRPAQNPSMMQMQPQPAASSQQQRGATKDNKAEGQQQLMEPDPLEFIPKINAERQRWFQDIEFRDSQASQEEENKESANIFTIKQQNKKSKENTRYQQEPEEEQKEESKQQPVDSLQRPDVNRPRVLQSDSSDLLLMPPGRQMNVDRDYSGLLQAPGPSDAIQNPTTGRQNITGLNNMSALDRANPLQSNQYGSNVSRYHQQPVSAQNAQPLRTQNILAPRQRSAPDGPQPSRVIPPVSNQYQSQYNPPSQLGQPAHLRNQTGHPSNPVYRPPGIGAIAPPQYQIQSSALPSQTGQVVQQSFPLRNFTGRPQHHQQAIANPLSQNVGNNPYQYPQQNVQPPSYAGQNFGNQYQPLRKKDSRYQSRY